MQNRYLIKIQALVMSSENKLYTESYFIKIGRWCPIFYGFLLYMDCDEHVLSGCIQLI